jgi:hypothetical protein
MLFRCLLSENHVMNEQTARTTADSAAATVPTSCFAVHAAVEPGPMPRIVHVFAKRGLVPDRLHGVADAARDELVVDVEMTGLAREAAMRIAAEMRALQGVTLLPATETRAI